MTKKKDVATIMLGMIVAIILWTTIFNRDTLIGTPVKYPLFHSFISFIKDIRRGRAGVNFLGNIMLFLPVGLLLPLMDEKFKCQWIVFTGAGLSLVIEFVQLITARGCFDLDDVILNSLGTTIGLGLWKAFTRRRILDA